MNTNMMVVENKGKELLAWLRPYAIPFLCLFLLYSFGISAIVRANVYYIDDVQRATDGMRGWSNYSRYINDYLSAILHTDTYLTDLSPFTQWLAALFMAAAGTALLAVFQPTGQKIGCMAIVALIPFGLSPYFLQCYSYKFDAPYMALSVLAMVFPLLFHRQKWWVYGAVSLCATLVMCMTYQASSGIYPMLVLFLCLAEWKKGVPFRKCAGFATLSALWYLLANLLFRYGIMREMHSYASTATLPTERLLSGFIVNLKKYGQHIAMEFRWEWLVLIGVVALCFLYVSLRDTKQKRWLTLLMTLCVACVGFVLSYGGYLFLQKPLYSPRALYGFGIWIVMFTLGVSTCKRAYVGKLVCLVLCYAFFSFAISYGNALYMQKQYTEYTAQSVATALCEAYPDAQDGQVTVYIQAPTTKAPRVENYPEHQVLLKRLTQTPFSQGSYFAHFLLQGYVGYDTFHYSDALHDDLYQLPITKNTLQYCIRGNDTTAFVQLK